MADIASMLSGLTPWQRWLLDGAMQSGGRRSGRSLWTRTMIEVYAAAGEHVHAVSRDGSVWCVTRQSAGYLWARIR